MREVAPSGEMDGKFCIATHYSMWFLYKYIYIYISAYICVCVCVCVLYVSIPEVHGRFYGLDLKNIFGQLGTFHKSWIRQILLFSENAIASCVSPSWIKNIYTAEKERERKVKMCF